MPRRGFTVEAKTVEDLMEIAGKLPAFSSLRWKLTETTYGFRYDRDSNTVWELESVGASLPSQTAYIRLSGDLGPMVDDTWPKKLQRGIVRRVGNPSLETVLDRLIEAL
jgi:hypothetical protein